MLRYDAFLKTWQPFSVAVAVRILIPWRQWAPARQTTTNKNRNNSNNNIIVIISQVYKQRVHIRIPWSVYINIYICLYIYLYLYNIYILSIRRSCRLRFTSFVRFSLKIAYLCPWVLQSPFIPTPLSLSLSFALWISRSRSYLLYLVLFGSPSCQ